MSNQLFIFTFDYHWSLGVFDRREGCAQTWEHNCQWSVGQLLHHTNNFFLATVK
jgi:hypothetical protein